MKLANRFGKFVFPIVGFFVFLSIAGCIPQEKAISLDSLTDGSTSESVGRGEFVGITSAQTMNGTKVKVSWADAKQDSVVAYNIYDVTNMFTPVLVKTVSAPATEYTLTGLKPQTKYVFRVRSATAKNVEDSNKADLPAVTYGGAISASVQNSTSASIQFNAGGDADEIRIYCYNSINPIYMLVKTITNVTLVSETVSNLTPGQFYTCRVALFISGTEDNNIQTVSFTPVGQASQLVFTTQPGSASAGIVLPSQPVITIKDVNGNVVSAGPDSTVVVTLSVALTSPSLGTVRGTASVSAVAGVATFSGINFQEAGVKILTASKADTSSLANGSGVLTVDSNNFTISPGNVSALQSTISISPEVPPNTALVANGNNSYTVIMKIRDQYNNPITGIKPTFASSITGGDTLSQPTLNTDLNGETSGSISTTVADSIAPFRVLSILSPNGLSTVTTLAPFIPGPPTKLAFTVQPSNSPAGVLGLATVKVAVQDAQGNIVNTGTASTSNISLSIASNLNGAILSGTYPLDAVSGIASFTDLGISKTQTGYKLLASSGSLTPAYSNNFNITAGTPKKIIISGPGAVVSGTCSSAFTIQLQDNGSNPANAIQNMPVSISGLGTAQIFSSASCAGTALGSSITFTSGTNTKTVYMKDMKAEGFTFTVTDSSAVLATGTLAVQSSPAKISILAQAAPPAPNGTSLTVVAGACSTKIVVTTAGENGAAGPLFVATSVQISGIAGTNALLYDNASCTGTPLDTTAVILPASVGSVYTTNYYLKDLHAETLNINVIDNSGVISTTSGLQAVSVLASNINFTGPTSVVAGLCSAAFTVTLADAVGTAVVTPNNVGLTINGLSGSVDGKFYTSSSCAGGGSATTITIPANASSLTIYFKDRGAEVLSLFISDPNAVLVTSPTRTMSVSPSALAIVTPSPANAKTNVCAGPFTVNTLDGNAAVCSAISTVNVNLSGANTGGTFYSDSSCTTPITSVQFTTGQSAKTFYFQSYAPSTGPGHLSLTATDAATTPVLTQGISTWQIVAAPAWIGTNGSGVNSGGVLNWFQTGVTPVSARVDGPASVKSLHFNSNKQYLYVVDSIGNRVLKYDYQAHTYVGWIGAFSAGGGIGITGSSLSNPSPAACVSTVNGAVTPGWCLGGQSTTGTGTVGGLYAPTAITSATTSFGNFIYVTSLHQGVSRYNADTGAFDGYIGRISTVIPTANGTGASGCTSAATGAITPGWCKGGNQQQNANLGNGGFYYAQAITNDGTYLYVANLGSVMRYNLDTGAFKGWIGWVNGTAPTSNMYTAGCTTTTNNKTPGWCVGGANTAIAPNTSLGGMYNPTSLVIVGSTLYVVDGNYLTVAKFDVNTGTFIGNMPSFTFNVQFPLAMIYDSVNSLFYIADRNRIARTDTTGLVTGWMGKVLNSASMSGNSGCSTLVPNANTPGWCLGGSAKPGVDETSFNGAFGIEDDGNGNLLVGQGGYNYNLGWQYWPAIKIFDKATGAYGGTLAFTSKSPTNWTNNLSAFAQNIGFDDNSFANPSGIYNDGTYLYIADSTNARVKKVNLATGQLVGWIGGVSTSPTGGAGSCPGSNAMAGAPGWCKGAMPNVNWLWNQMIGQTTNGIFYSPRGITGDGTHIYITDTGTHRISKFVASTGVFVGWIGNISISPTGGATGCVGAASSTYTPGWCTGGISTSGTGNGMLNSPQQITYLNGNLYVADSNNHRIMSYVASSGAFNGWIGRIGGSNPTVCTYGNNGAGYNVSQSGWCMGGTSVNSTPQGVDKGGGYYNPTGITNDGSNLLIGDYNNNRIVKVRASDGVTLAAVRLRADIYSDVWQTSYANMSTGWYNISPPYDLWNDGTYIYATAYNITGTSGSGVIKVNLSTGTVVGWQGAITASPTAGDTNCAGAFLITPGWCQGGQTAVGYTMGGFNSPSGITGDSNFVYVVDSQNNRVTRLPK